MPFDNEDLVQLDQRLEQCTTKLRQMRRNADIYKGLIATIKDIVIKPETTKTVPKLDGQAKPMFDENNKQMFEEITEPKEIEVPVDNRTGTTFTVQEREQIYDLIMAKGVVVCQKIEAIEI